MSTVPSVDPESMTTISSHHETLLRQSSMLCASSLQMIVAEILGFIEGGQGSRNIPSGQSPGTRPEPRFLVRGSGGGPSEPGTSTGFLEGDLPRPAPARSPLGLSFVFKA